MLTLVAMMIAPPPVAAVSATVVAGRCHYPDRVIRERQDTILILCDTATIDRDGGTVTFDFAQRSWGSMARITGTMNGRTMAVSRVTLRGGDSTVASGTCTIDYRDGTTPSVIACLAHRRSRTLAVNFLASRL